VSPLGIIALALAGLGVLVGMAGTILPVLPGLPLIFFSIVLYAAVTNFARITLLTILALGVITLVSFLVDALAVTRGVRKMGGSTQGMLGAVVGALLGVLMANLPGLIGGMILGVVVGELLAGSAPRRMIPSAIGAVLGVLVSAVIRLMLALAMVTIAIVDLIRS
jgi:hypothetical protein